ncbi:MAG: TIGR04086 family membrane protein [Bacilli bacterium]|nr:TIGR04086 family membrane protein [Bacilli bacterium]
MKKLIIYLKDISYFFIPLIIITIILSLLNYLGVLNYKTVKIISFIMTILLFMFLGIKTAKRSQKKGYINGLKISLIGIFMFLILSLLTFSTIKWQIIIYYFILLVSGTLGGMIGVNINTKNK